MKSETVFLDFDTETANRPGGGQAVLLIRSTPTGGVEFREFPETFDDIWKFLKGSKYVCWNMDFDARAICHLEFLPVEIIEALALYGRAKWSGWRFHYTPGKFLEVSRKGETFTLYDLASFYGMSLAAASKAYLPVQERKHEIPKAWYKEMDRCLLDGRRTRLLDYARFDIIALSSLRRLLLGSLRGIGLSPTRLTSPAAISMMVFGKKLAAVKPPDRVNRIFERSFFGGRVEIGTIGLVGPCRLYDLHSAYPAVMADLRAPRYDLISSSGITPGARFGAYKIEAFVPPSWRWGPLAARHGDKVVYPVGRFKTWCGRAGVEALQRYGVAFSVIEAHELFEDESADLIFPQIPKMYAERKIPGLSLALKLAMNSGYGKTCETVNYAVEDDTNGKAVGLHRLRQRSQFGRFTNYPFAAEITERIRIKIWEVLHAHGIKAHYAATDGIITEGELPTSADLGAWDLKGEYSKAVILGCGRYLLYTGDERPELHLRGFPLKSEPRALERLSSCRRRFLDFSMLDSESLRQWAMRYCAGDLNVLKMVKRRLTVEDDKRHWPELPRAIGDCWTRSFDSQSLIFNG